MPVIVARLGELVYVGYGMEVFTKIGIEVKGISPARHTLFASLTNGCTGYLPSPEEHARGGYEVDLSPLFYRLPGRLDAQCSHLVISKTVKLLESVWKAD